MSKKYRISEFAAKIGRDPSTIRRWEAEGRFKAKRLSSGQRYFEEADVLSALGVSVATGEAADVAGLVEDLANLLYRFQAATRKEVSL